MVCVWMSTLCTYGNCGAAKGMLFATVAMCSLQAISSMSLGNALYNVEMLTMSDMNKATMTMKTKGFGKAAKGGPNRVRVLKMLYLFCILGFGGTAMSCKKCGPCAGGEGGDSEETTPAPGRLLEGFDAEPAELVSWRRKLQESEDFRLRGWTRQLQAGAEAG